MSRTILLLLLSIFSAGIAVILGIYNYRKEENKKRKKALNILTVIAGLVAVAIFLFSNQVESPTIHHKEDYLTISSNDVVEYQIVNDTVNYSDDNWIKYEKPINSSEIKKSSIIYARAKALWNYSPEVFRIVYILDNGLMYTSEVDKPKDSVLDISAEYKYKEPKNGEAGNHYSGYKITKGDFLVSGITVGKEKVEISDFIISPDILSEGYNTIEIKYAITNEKYITTKINVEATYPKLISLKAEYKGSKVYPDTVLDVKDFIVSGKKENSKEENIEGFSIFPTELKDGKNIITITKDDMSTTVELNTTDKNALTGEVEPNDDTFNANEIDVNTKYSGNLNNEEDEDFFKLVIKEKGRIQLSLSHQKLDNSYELWNATLLSKTKEPIVELKSTGENTETFSPRDQISPGEYYIKVSSLSYSDVEYIISALFEKVDDSYEIEPNDKLESQAMPIELDKKYTGNIKNKADVDCYKFRVSEKRKVWIDFSHPKTNSNYEFWEVVLSGDDPGNFIDFYSNGETGNYSSDRVRLPAGNYYLKISPNSWSDIDYSFCITSEKEGDETENENNNDYAVATNIKVNSNITGNIQSKEDVDFYKFELKNTSSLTLYFDHDIFDSEYVYWKVELSTNNNNAIKNDEKHSVLEICGNSTNSASWSSLSDGTYYLKVYKFNYSNNDYTISISD